MDTDIQDVRPGFGLLRRDTGFSIASLAASLPGTGMRSKTPVQKDEESGQQLVEVPSRPASIRSLRVPSSSEEDSDGEEDEEEDEEEEHDTRSIRSFESMMSSRSKERRRKKIANANAHGRKSITDRLASMPGLSRLSGGAHDPPKVSKTLFYCDTSSSYVYRGHLLPLVVLPCWFHQSLRHLTALTLLSLREQRLLWLSGYRPLIPASWSAPRTTSKCQRSANS